jgi:hypothetical protein
MLRWSHGHCVLGLLVYSRCVHAGCVWCALREPFALADVESALSVCVVWCIYYIIIITTYTIHEH